jgi:hypothetical protein
MLRLVALVRTGVSEEFSASFIRVKRIGELGRLLAVNSIVIEDNETSERWYCNLRITVLKPRREREKV